MPRHDHMAGYFRNLELSIALKSYKQSRVSDVAQTDSKLRRQVPWIISLLKAHNILVSYISKRMYAAVLATSSVYASTNHGSSPHSVWVPELISLIDADTAYYIPDGKKTVASSSRPSSDCTSSIADDNGAFSSPTVAPSVTTTL